MVSLFLYGNYSLKYLSEFFYYLYVIQSEAFTCHPERSEGSYAG